MFGLDLGIRQDAEERREAALWIAVDDQDLVPADAQALGKRHCRRRLGDAALEIGDGDCDRLGAWRTHPSGRSSRVQPRTSGKLTRDAFPRS